MNTHSERGERRLTASVSGEVQGVGFRYRTQRRAVQLGLTGVVSNMSDGSVRVVAEGREPALDGLREFLRGPEAPGVVTGVEESFGPATGEFADFRAE